MKKLILIACILALALVAGCVQQTRCLEQPSDCSSDSTPVECPQVTCEECPQLTTEEIPENQSEVVKYVCLGTNAIADDPTQCTPEPQEREVPSFVPLTTNEEGTFIKNVTAKPSCIDGLNGGLIFYDIGRLPKTTTVEVKTVDDYETVYTKSPGIYSSYVSFVICDTCSEGDFQLRPGTAYLLRVQFDLGVLGGVQYSNEHIVNTTPTSPYLTKICSR